MKAWLNRIGLALIFATALFSQTTDSILVGTISDPAGAVIPGATVTATNRATNVKYTTVANSTGEYRINNIPAGRYDVTGTAQGFTTVTVSDVEMQLNHTSTINVRLTVGAVSTVVQVEGSAATIDTATAQVQNTFDSKQAVEAPVAGISKVVNGAGIYNLSLLGAGVASSGGIGQGTGPSVAGQRPENNSFNIDGVNNNSGYSTGPEVYVSNEAIAQFNIAQNQFSAEFGGASGGVFNVTVKSGTNHVHGSIFEYMQNRVLDAVDYSQVVAGSRENPRFDSNRFGATIGGPIKKDKLFYFGSYEYAPLGQSAIPGNPVDAPTAAGITALNSIAGVNKTNLGVFTQYVPLATSIDPTTQVSVKGVNIPVGLLSFASPNFNNSYHGIVAIDYNFSDRDQLRGRYIYDKTAGLDFNANLPIFFQPNPVTNNSVSLSEFHTFSNSMINEFRLSYRRYNGSTGAGDFKFPGLDAFPNLQFDDLGLQVGPDPNTPTGAISNTSTLQENLTKTWGRHTFKMGYNITDIILDGTFVQRSRGDYDYASFEQYLLDQQPTGGAFGVPSSGERTGGAATGVPFGNLQHAAYFNDDYRVRPNLTLNLGLRYEYVTIPVGSRAQQYSAIADVPGVFTFHAPLSTKNDWSPRLGFAYSPGNDGKWSIRGGVGRSFDNTYINLNQNASPAFYATTTDVNAANPVSNFLANGGLPGTAPSQATQALARQSISNYTFDQHRPYALTGTLGVQRLLGKDYVLEARYVYTKGVHLWNQTRPNVVPQVTATNFIPTYLSTPSASVLAADKLTLAALQTVIPAGGTALEPWNNLAIYGFKNAIVGYNPWGNSIYHGLALQVNKRYSKNFSYIAAYTWSHNMDDSTATNNSTILSPRRSQDFHDQRSEWASSALDRRQRFTFSPTYDFKPFQGSNWMLKNIVGNWNLTGTYTFQSPEYVTIQDGIDANLNNDATGDRTIVNPAGDAKTGSGVTGLNAKGQSVATLDSLGCTGFAKLATCQGTTVAYVANNANARYITAGLGAQANGGRNSFPLGRTNNVDFALMKKINFSERMNVNFGAQFFNLFNHSQFVGGYLSDVSLYSTSAINRSFLTPASSTFLQYQNYFPSNSRAVQIVARFTF